MVLNIQLLFLMSSTKCDASIECDALLDRDQEEQLYLEDHAMYWQCLFTGLDY